MTFGLRKPGLHWLLEGAALLALVVILTAGQSAWFEHTLDEGATLEAGDAMRGPVDPSLVQRGAYLARLGHCAGCHTARGGAELAGGRALPTRFGNVYAGNLTPDEATGLGQWTAHGFWRALHLGRSRDGRMLLPVFPYPHFTQVTRSDSDALHAYLRSLAPVRIATPPHELRFPYNTQAALAVWRLLSFRPSAPVVAQPPLAPLQRGAYLVQGLGHCGACHAPRIAWGAVAAQLTGFDMPGQRWHAPSLLPGGPGQGSVEDTVALLKSGGSVLGRASGPMAAVVGGSLQYWTEGDLRAAVLYLRSLPAQAAMLPSATLDVPQREGLGGRLYREQCRDCHGANGEGVAGIYPALAGNATVLQPTALNLVQVITHGGFGPTTVGNPRPFGMPPLVLGDAELGALVSHVRQSWGNRAGAVSNLDVLRLR